MLRTQATFVGAALLASAAAAQPAPPLQVNDMPMDDYLGLLEKMAPAARDGARAYANAFQRRCGRPLSTAELRRATSAGNGDPVLMSMIRSSRVRDAQAIAELGQRIECGSYR